MPITFKLSQIMIVKIKKTHPDAVIPFYSKPGDAGMDLTAVSDFIDSDGNYVYDTGIAVEIPEGFVGLLFPRSSVCKTGLSLTNCVGVIDSGFRGSISFKFKPLYAHNISPYIAGDRVGQMIIMPYPNIQFEESEELSTTDRSNSGYGSTGR